MKTSLSLARRPSFPGPLFSSSRPGRWPAQPNFPSLLLFQRASLSPPSSRGPSRVGPLCSACLAPASAPHRMRTRPASAFTRASLRSACAALTHARPSRSDTRTRSSPLPHCASGPARQHPFLSSPTHSFPSPCASFLFSSRQWRGHARHAAAVAHAWQETNPPAPFLFPVPLPAYKDPAEPSPLPLPRFAVPVPTAAGESFAPVPNQRRRRASKLRRCPPRP